MAVGKALNKKSFYGGSETGQTPDIAMPNYDEQTPIAQSAPDPWSQQQEQQSSSFGQVPEELPQEVEQEMEEQVPKESSSSYTAPTKEDHPNFKSIRDAKERAERERDALMSQMLEMQSKLQEIQKSQQQSQAYQHEQQDVDIDFDIDSESLVEGKHVKKVAAKIKAIEQQMKKYQAQTEEVAIEAKIKAQFPDFEKVVSRENVELLNKQYPEIAQSLRDTPDIYNKAAAAYTVIKNFGLYKDAAPYENDRLKALNNAQKPRPLASVSPTQGDSPLSKANAFANGMTDELKEQLRKEMFAARRAM